MKIKQLKKMLEGLDDNVEVIMSKDSEGNRFSLLAGYDSGWVNKRDVKERYIDTYYSEGYNFRDNGFSSEEQWQKFKKKAKKVIVLCPSN